ncbi:MAG: DUF3486 family protein [Methylovulum sp.]|nr:DUF3486 family protein [Methylovulum sp.]
MPPRSIFDTMPDAVRDELNQKLFGSGFGDLVALSAWLGQQGYEVSKSSLGVYSKGLKDKMERATARARERLEIAKTLRGTTDDEKAALLELSEMASLDQLLDMLESASDLTMQERLKFMPRIIAAGANLNRSAVGSAKWKREFEQQIREQERLKAAEDLSDGLKNDGISPELEASIRRILIGK